MYHYKTISLIIYGWRAIVSTINYILVLMPRALDHLCTVPLRTPPAHSSQLLTEFASVRWNGPGQLKVPPQSSLIYFRAIGATTSPVRTYVRGNVYYF